MNRGIEFGIWSGCGICCDGLTVLKKSFFPILIAGTKGKGSTGFFLESILTASQIPVGFYVSPHLEDSRERIRFNGNIISKKMWVQGLLDIRHILRLKRLPNGVGNFTYFEIVTALAILLFKQLKVRIGIFEVGMGGAIGCDQYFKCFSGYFVAYCSRS